MKINLVKKENDFFKDDFKKQLNKNLLSAKFILGPDVKKLEDNLSNYIGNKYSIFSFIMVYGNYLNILEMNTNQAVLRIYEEFSEV